MADNELPDAVRRLVRSHLPSVDHVAVLLAVRGEPERLHGPASIASLARVDERVADRVLADLAASQLLEREGDGFRFATIPAVRDAVGELARMYDTRPVTLIRAIYDRPPLAAQSFADAFRIRRPED